MMSHQRRAIDNEYSPLPTSQLHVSTTSQNPDSSSLNVQLVPEHQSIPDLQMPLLNGLHNGCLNNSHDILGNRPLANGRLHRNRHRGDLANERHTVYLENNLGDVPRQSIRKVSSCFHYK